MERGPSTTTASATPLVDVNVIRVEVGKCVSVRAYFDQSTLYGRTTFYWYQRDVGYDHAPMPPLEERAALLLHPNLKDEDR